MEPTKFSETTSVIPLIDIVNGTRSTSYYHEPINHIFTSSDIYNYHTQLTEQNIKEFNAKPGILVIMQELKGYSPYEFNVPLIQVFCDDDDIVISTQFPSSRLVKSYSGIIIFLALLGSKHLNDIQLNDCSKVSKQGLHDLLKMKSGQMLMPTQKLRKMDVNTVVTVMNALFSEKSPIDELSKLVTDNILVWYPSSSQ